jgi:DNA-binding response OmpR family regulator
MYFLKVFSMNKKVLLVEDDLQYAERCINEIKQKGYEVHHVSCGNHFWKVFNQFQNDWCVVVMCAHLDGYSTYTEYHVKEIRKRTGDRIKIIANSTNDKFNQLLIAAGCNHRSTGGRFHSWALPKVIEGTLRFCV